MSASGFRLHTTAQGLLNMHVEVHVAYAFVNGDWGGNPAGVVVDADALTPAQRSEVARLVGLSETACVSECSLGDFKLEFFTPRRQIAQCGHATVATAWSSFRWLSIDPD